MRPLGRRRSADWQRLATRGVLLAPGPLRRAAAQRVADPAGRWMLAQDRAVRESFVRAVLDRSANGRPDDRLMQIWMLRQPDAVRESFIRDVLGDAPPAVD